MVLPPSPFCSGLWTSDRLQVGAIDHPNPILLSGITARSLSGRVDSNYKSLSLMSGGCLQLAAVGSIPALVISPDVSLRSELHVASRAS